MGRIAATSGRLMRGTRSKSGRKEPVREVPVAGDDHQGRNGVVARCPEVRDLLGLGD